MAELWWSFWLCLGAALAYLYAGVAGYYCFRNQRGPDELVTAVAVASGAVFSWFVGYLVVGPWWAVLTAPAVLAAALSCSRVYAYMREHEARVRVGRREAGR